MKDSGKDLKFVFHLDLLKVQEDIIYYVQPEDILYNDVNIYNVDLPICNKIL